MGAHCVLRLLILFTGISILQKVRGWNIRVPKMVKAIEGSCVVVPCQTEPHSRVIWYKYQNIHYPVVYDGLHPSKQEQQFKGRTMVHGNAAEGNCTLTINDMRREENYLQVYVWINPESKAPQKFYDQTVTIIVEREAPMISIQRQIVEGEIFQANCTIKYSCPFLTPSLHWNKSQFLTNTTLMDFKQEAQGQWLYRETLHVLATYEMHNSKMWCTAQFRTYTTESQQITLNISYSPVMVSLIMEKEAVMEGGSVNTECAAKSNPQPHTYSWFRRQMGRSNKLISTQSNMYFYNITRSTSLSCIAHNIFGEGQSSWVDLDVQYPPVILPASSCKPAGDFLRCVCQAEASPHASISWIVDGNETLPSSVTSVYTNENVVFGEMNIPYTQKVNVSCTAWNPFGSDTKHLYIFSYPNTLWLSGLIFLGIALLSGCSFFIYRKYTSLRTLTLSRRPSICISVKQEEEERYNNPERSQDGETQSGRQRPERNSEEERLSCIYDNEFVEEVRASVMPPRGQNNAATDQREDETQPEDAVYGNTDVYLNSSASKGHLT